MVSNEIFTPYNGTLQYVRRKSSETGQFVAFKLPQDTRSVIRTFSDIGLPIRKVGTDEVYADGEAFDIEGNVATYEEIYEGVDLYLTKYE